MDLQLLSRRSIRIAGRWPALLGACLLGSAAAWAQPAQWSGNNHWYEVVAVPDGINWQDAQAIALNRGGYLATLTTNAENAFVFTLADASPSAWSIVGGPFGEVSGPWLGGFQPQGAPEPFGDWTWVNGEGLFTSAGYNTNWISASPNNFGGNENRIHFYGLNLVRQAAWNDRNDGGLISGYVIEWTTAPVPEPGTWALMLAGWGTVQLLLRRRARVAG